MIELLSEGSSRSRYQCESVDLRGDDAHFSNRNPATRAFNKRSKYNQKSEVIKELLLTLRVTRCPELKATFGFSW